MLILFKEGEKEGRTLMKAAHLAGKVSLTKHKRGPDLVQPGELDGAYYTQISLV